MTAPPGLAPHPQPSMSPSMRPEQHLTMPTLAWCENAVRVACEEQGYALVPRDEVRRAAKQYRREWLTHLNPPVDLRTLGIYSDRTAQAALTGRHEVAYSRPAPPVLPVPVR